MESDEDEFGELTRLLLLLEDDEICFDLCELLIEDEELFHFCNIFLEKMMIPHILQEYADEELINILEEYGESEKFAKKW